MAGKEEELLGYADADYKERYGFSDKTEYAYRTEKGLSESIIREISKIKNEPEWMLEKRLTGYKVFKSKPMPTWGADLSGIDFDDVYYYMKPGGKKEDAWDKVPDDIKRTFDKLGIPEAERKFFAGAEIQYDSEVVYGHVKAELEKEGVIFTDTDTAIKKYPELVKRYFGTIIPPTDNKFAALNTAVFSGGSFIYVPKGVKVKMPLQAYFRINAEKAGQFERTLIIADEGADVTYIEGCLPADELVSKGDSLKEIVDIKVGEEVISHTGKKQRVKRRFVHPHDGIMLTIVPLSKGNAFRLTGEHPVLSVRRIDVLTKRKARNGWLPEVSTKTFAEAIPTYRNAAELEVGDFIVYVVPNVTVDDKDVSGVLSKILGIYLAEGSISFNKSLNRNVLQFSFGKSDKEKNLATEIRDVILSLGEKASLTLSGQGYYTVSSYSKKLIELCLKHCGKGAATKVLSKKIMELPVQKQKILLDYYLKGDGNHYTKKENMSLMIRAATVSKMLAYQLQEILGRTGIFANISVRKGGKDKILGREITRKDQYIIEYTENKIWSEVRKKDNVFFVPIKEIRKEQFKGDVFNVAVSEDESYLVKGFAVHNCTAPVYIASSLHSAVVEIMVHKDAHVRYVTIQNWSRNVYNLVTQRAYAYENAHMEWIDANIGSKVNMKYPSVYLKGRGAKGEILSVAVAGENQVQDSGGKMLHLAPDTTSKIISKSVSKKNGMASYRGQLYISKDAANVKSTVRCDALLIDKESKTNTYPYMDVHREDATITHEAAVGKIGEEQLFYLMSRGLTEEQSLTTVVLGFLDPLTKALPMEYSIELKRLIQLDTTNSVA